MLSVKILNQVAFSSAEEFLEKYKDDSNIIGHFGLGFYSAFMVADKVEAITLVAGNVPVEQGVHNALYTLDLCGVQVPVYQGAAKPLLHRQMAKLPKPDPARIFAIHEYQPRPWRGCFFWG